MAQESLVLLEVQDLDALLVLHGRALGRGYTCAAFREPDLGGQLTALALGPEARPIVSSLPLAFRAP